MRGSSATPAKLVTGLLAAGAMLAGCDADTSAWTTGQPPAPTPAATDGYIAPPRVTAAQRTPQGLRLSGVGRPGARVRLGPPSGEAMFAVTDRAGGWTLTLPVSDEVRLFGLSMAVGDRAVQSEGYLMLLPDGRVVQLRAGAGAATLAAPTPAPRLLAIDYDGEGGAIISGSAPAGQPFSARIDRANVIGGRANGEGRFAVSLSEPLAPGIHEIELVGDEGRDAVMASISPPSAPPAPYRGERTAHGWRVDWLTPGGGVQTTLVFDRAGAGA